MIFHNGAKDFVINPLHARIPVNQFRTNQWVNLCIDTYSFSQFCFKGVTYRSIDLIKLAGSCKVRRIFTTLNPVYDDEFDSEPQLVSCLEKLQLSDGRSVYTNNTFDNIPTSVEFPNTCMVGNQLFFPQRI